MHKDTPKINGQPPEIQTKPTKVSLTTSLPVCIIDLSLVNKLKCDFVQCIFCGLRHDYLQNATVNFVFFAMNFIRCSHD